ncbi:MULTISPECIES: M1 family metallopeptidase [Streptomycetaceae]|uniref:Aminopeptidase N n=1 Tax=Streptantibioticus cattleyicolor (strain ATCC 35852 / DSM 46488 / JCM 4925 / NBRC 14057 / NRRL 8057) TaxID=1003195 RepID=F8JRG3_STREN|nr:MULTISPECIES: M1 family metallopeptidase [Streptomycetaceae]AEW96665.1 metallopeptidase [Streptantibioticus cattleyicolor NRRL 8057 = DSM 46488]MYS61158.1 M1 family peptidase [Streptomyces sp. SID5468]CCB77005.1 putative metallopeptidase, secreted [Streptantibioticus cattleyicolor NRRL 8057 = DSM 46488]
MALSRPARLVALAVATASACMVAVGTSPASAASSVRPGVPTPGAPGIGDSYFPDLGNGGFDVRHYGLGISYDPASGRLDGRAAVTSRATQDLSRFDLDLQRLTVDKVTVDGRRARFTRRGDELVITPARPLRRGRTFTTDVTYHGIPQPLGGPIVFGSKYGWMKTKTGVFVACEPNAASTWFPSSDHPSDKATFDITMDAPKGLTGVSNGRLVSTWTKGDRTWSHWRETRPMATYLATATIDRFHVRTGRTPGGIPMYVAIDPDLEASSKVDVYQVTSDATDYWSKVFGPYPFEETGAIVDDMPLAGFSLEVQSKPVYSAVRSESTIVHELAHQWFGDSVSVRRWKDIWLNEGFATYAQWLWAEHKGTRSAHDSFLAAYNSYPADNPFWKIKVDDPQRDTMFSDAVYDRGAMTLQMLRERIGDQAFFRLLKVWTSEHRYGNAQTSDFVRTAERVSGKPLGDLFRTWLETPARPSLG